MFLKVIYIFSLKINLKILVIKEIKGKGGSKENVGKKRLGFGKSSEGRILVS